MPSVSYQKFCRKIFFFLPECWGRQDFLQSWAASLWSSPRLSRAAQCRCLLLILSELPILQPRSCKHMYVCPYTTTGLNGTWYPRTLESNTRTVLNRSASNRAVTAPRWGLSPGQFPRETPFTCSHQHCFKQCAAEACGWLTASRLPMLRQ